MISTLNCGENEFDSLNSVRNIDITQKRIEHSFAKLYKYCPRESLYTSVGDQTVCTKCEHDTIRNDDFNICNRCFPHHYATKDQFNELICKPCRLGYIAFDEILGFNGTKCFETNCTNYEFIDIKYKNCVKCSKFIEKSIGRRNYTHPLIGYCKCPDDVVKIHCSKTPLCLSLEGKNELRRLIKETFEMDYYKVQANNYYENKTKVSIEFIHCHPTLRFFSDEKDCLCKKGFQFADYSCKQCLVHSISANIHDRRCKTCLTNETISVDKSKCLCSIGYEKNGERCVKCLNGYYRDNLSDKK
ncbi:MAG: hypothetical protein MHPSP_002312, partial [Paramarteilia canceri]